MKSHSKILIICVSALLLCSCMHKKTELEKAQRELDASQKALEEAEGEYKKASKSYDDLMKILD